jgi:lysozyme
MIEGIDVSRWQGKIDWQKVADSKLIEFAVCKATERNKVDREFKNNWEKIPQVGLIRGAYHFARTDNTFIQEADHFLNTLGPLTATDMLVLDIEESTIKGTAFTDWVLGWLEYVEQKTGKVPFVYTYGPFWAAHIGKPSLDVIKKFQKYPLWLAAYTKNPDIFIPSIWKQNSWTIWQKSGNIAAPGEPLFYVPGITGPVDRNVFRGTSVEFKQLLLNLHVPLVGMTGEAVDTIIDSSED